METQLRKNIIWNAFGNIVYLGLQWVVTVMVTRLMGLEDAGVLSLAMSISASFQTIAMFGIRNYQVSDINDKYTDGCYVFVRVITCAVAFVLCAAFSCVNGYSLTQIAAVMWFMLFRLAENFSDVLHGILQKNNRLDIAGKAFAIKGVVTIAAFCVGYTLSKSLNISLALMATGSVMSTFLFDFINARKISDFKIKTEKKACIALIRETAPLCAYLFFSAAISTAPKYILEKMCDEKVLGAYSSIYAPALLIQAAASYIFVPFTGKFAQLHQDHDVKGFRRLLIKICAAVLVLSVTIIVCAVPLGDWILELLFGSSISEYTYLLFPILICVFMGAFMSLFCTLCVVVRAFKELIAANVVGLVLCCALTPVFISCFGANGASFGLIAGIIVACIIMAITILKVK